MWSSYRATTMMGVFYCVLYEGLRVIDHDAVVVGAGFAGLYMLHELRILSFNCQVFEAGSGVGGTWYWNRYPGARCDTESFSCSYSFSEEIEQEWSWSHRCALQPEILAYGNFVADRLGLRRDINFEMRVTGQCMISGSTIGLSPPVSTSEPGQVRARYLILITGWLSVPKMPDLPGLAAFKGDVLHTAKWPAQG